MLVSDKTERLRSSPLFWFVTANFLYSGLTILLHVFRQYLIFDANISAEDYAYVSIINMAANISKNFMIFYVLVLLGKGFDMKSVKTMTK